MTLYAASLPRIGGFDLWRDAARRAISHDIPPDHIDWQGRGGLFAADPLPAQVGPRRFTVRKEAMELARSVQWHSAEDRFDLLYRAFWRLAGGQGGAISPTDPLGRRLQLMSKSIRRDIHKMHAFVRFRELPSDSARRSFAAWFEPEHFTLEPGSAFFAKRFADMDWQILTPDQSARFVAGRLTFGAGVPRPDLPEDASEELWGTYFANIFNPARVKITAMRSEMPKKYWHNLPETRLIPAMLADAEARVARMHDAGASVPRAGAAAISTRYRAAMPQVIDLPQSLGQARDAAAQCRDCGLCELATQTVWGAGNAAADLMVVGEQAGDQEDLQGRPFVGPAGQLLRSLIEEAGGRPSDLWLTNAVKHFKFTPRDGRRLHQTPVQAEVLACRKWLGLELAFVAPRLVLALGATTAFALTGQAGGLATRRGQMETGLHQGPVLISWHPAHILRLPDPAAQARARAELLADIRHARLWSAQPQ